MEEEREEELDCTKGNYTLACFNHSKTDTVDAESCDESSQGSVHDQTKGE